MFCLNCGKELPNESRFCLHCGVSQATDSGTPVNTLPKGVRLKKRYTTVWEGECPACGLVHTSENTPCPVDGSPMVVAFDKRDRLIPIHSAALRCIRDCGCRLHVLTCSRDGTPIQSDYLRFQLPKGMRARANIIRLIRTTVGLVLLGYYAYIVEGVTQRNGKPWLGNAAIFVFSPYCICLSFGLYFTRRGIRGWRPFKEWYTFEDVGIAAHGYAKEEAREEAIATAKAVQDATRPWIQ